MAFRFRKSIKIAKGLKLNISKSGISASVGGKGLSFNIGKKGAKLTAGIPGTGLSHTSNLTPKIDLPKPKKIQEHQIEEIPAPPPQPKEKNFSWLAVIAIIFAALIACCIAFLIFGAILNTFFPTS